MPQRRALGVEIDTFEAPVVADTGKLPVEAQAADGETLGIADPEGVINLQQALGLALLGNPDLKSFSWQVRERPLTTQCGP